VCITPCKRQRGGGNKRDEGEEMKNDISRESSNQEKEQQRKEQDKGIYRVESSNQEKEKGKGDI